MPTRRCVAALVALAMPMSLIPGCGGEPPSCRGGAGDLDVVWIVLDAAAAWATSLHADAYGPPLPDQPETRTTPEIDRLAEESLVFERAFAQTAATRLSAASYLTGLYPVRPRVSDTIRAPTLATRLREQGYRTAARSENPWISVELGFDRGFEVFEVDADLPDAGATHRSMRAVDAALAWLASPSDAPRLLYLHLLPPHYPYAPPEPFAGALGSDSLPADWPYAGLARADEATPAVEPPASSEPKHDPNALRRLRRALDDEDSVASAPAVDWAALRMIRRAMEEGGADVPALTERLRRQYLENVLYADHLVGRVVAFLRESGRLERTILVVTADHGEGLGDHPELAHATSLYNDQIHVPLVVRAPRCLGIAPRRVDGVIELVDVVPTLLDWLGLDPGRVDGESLDPWLRGEAPAPVEARAFLGQSGQMLVRDAWKWIDRESGAELYDLSSDLREQRNLLEREPELAADLASQAFPTGWETVDHDEAARRLGIRQREQLEALGYVIDPTEQDDEDARTRPAAEAADAAP